MESRIALPAPRTVPGNYHGPGANGLELQPQRELAGAVAAEV